MDDDSNLCNNPSFASCSMCYARPGVQKRESFLLEGKQMYNCDKAVMIKMVNADGELGEGRAPNC